MPFRPVGPSGGFLAPTESNVAPYFFPGKFLPSCGLACLAFDVPESHLVSWSVDSTLPRWPLYLGKCRSFLYRLRTVTTWKGREVSSRQGEEPWDPHHQRGRGGPSVGLSAPTAGPLRNQGLRRCEAVPFSVGGGEERCVSRDSPWLRVWPSGGRSCSFPPVSSGRVPRPSALLCPRSEGLGQGWTASPHPP